MEKIVINTQGAESVILVGERWEAVHNFLPESGVVILTDTNVYRFYGNTFPNFPVLTIRPGESSKRLEVIKYLSEKLLEANVDRSGFILAIGGGVVCDIAGFLASIYMRGIRCASISTTLLSQVDASTGGKNGVNLGNFKNILGCFKQPEFVICDPLMLKTLHKQEYLSGLAELLKTAIIGNAELFDMIEKNPHGILERDPELMSILISMAVNFKSSIVSEDEKESGARRILNFGHTFGHALEMFMSIKHGYAVALGMELAALFSAEKGFIRKDECERMISCVKKFELLNNKHNMPDYQVRQLILHDKKKSGNEIHFVFTAGIGKTIIEKVPVDELVDFYRKVKESN